MVKSMSFLKRKSGITREEFMRYWKEEHGPIAAKIIPGLKRYVQNHPVDIPGVENEYDGIAEIWWESLDVAMKFPNWHKSEEARPLREDEEKFFDTSQRSRFFAEEHIVVE